MKNVKELEPLLAQRISEGYIKIRKHPEHELFIYNYTDKCQYDQMWDEATMNCRGLITDGEGNIVARGMPKFFNYGQDQAPKFGLDDVVFVADKVDGSLGIVYPLPTGGYAVATRGSFESDQAIHATEIYDGRFNFSAPGNNTFLVEIVYAENRVVVDYGGRDELVYLGYVENESGGFQPDPDSLIGLMTYGEALALPVRDNAEGLVLTRPSDYAMVKIKYDSYLALHRVIFGLTARKLWELMVAAEDVEAYMTALPDEFQPWARQTVEDIHHHAENLVAWNRRIFDEIRASLDSTTPGWGRKEFAEEAKKQSNPGALFALFDNKGIYPLVLKSLKPGPFITPVRPKTEDIA